jgi:hypothetical protein
MRHLGRTIKKPARFRDIQKWVREAANEIEEETRDIEVQGL